MVTITRESKKGEPYKSGFGTIELGKVANEERPVPKKFIRKDGQFVTSQFLDYVRPLIGELPSYSSLTIKMAKP